MNHLLTLERLLCPLPCVLLPLRPFKYLEGARTQADDHG